MDLLEVSQLCKNYPQGFAFGPVNFQLTAGETVALIGANGAGKSTLFEMLTGNSDPSGGEIFFLGQKLSPEACALKRKIGYLPQNLPFPRWVTGLEMLRYAASLHQLADPKTQISRAMEYWDCASYADKSLAACSHGMQKRVALALATLHDPPCLILDEPSSGLDIFHMHALELEIDRRQKDGKTTILSTHIAASAAKLCQRVFILQKGQLQLLAGWEDKSFVERMDLVERQFFG